MTTNKETTKTPTIRLPKDATWVAGRVPTWGSRHTITVIAGKEVCNLVYDMGRNSFYLAGIERSVTLRAADGSPIHSTEHLPGSVISKATWLRIYRADKARRGALISRPKTSTTRSTTFSSSTQGR